MAESLGQHLRAQVLHIGVSLQLNPAGRAHDVLQRVRLSNLTEKQLILFIIGNSV